MSKQEDFSVDGNITGYEVHPLFPIPIFTLENVLDKDVPILREIQSIPMRPLIDDEYGQRSENSYVLNNPSFADLKQKLMFALQDYANNVLGYAGKFSITQSWVSVKNPGQRHTMHSHANSIISGVYYFNNQDESSGLTFIKNGAGNSNTFTMAPLVNQNVQNQFTYNEVTLSVENNMVCMFPSFLPHRVSQNTTNDTRYSIAFNAMPTYALGSEDNLTECEFLRINTK
jgi:uncharacterized protein (TIGR02466 family)